MVTFLSHNTHLTTLPHLIRRRQLSFDPKPNFREEICYPISQRITCNSIKTHVDGRRVHYLTSTRCKRPIFGSLPLLSWRHDSSSYMRKQGNEELGDSDDDSPARHSSAEIARTIIKGHPNAWLLFLAMEHSEPHVQISWAEFQYLTNWKGDVYFEISNDANILKDHGDHGERYPVNALIGMDITTKEDADKFRFSIFSDPYIEVVNRDCDDMRMIHPSNGVSIFGYLRRANAKERMMYCHDDDKYCLSWEGLFSSNINYQRDFNSMLYKLEIWKLKLHYVYGSQSEIGWLEFEDAEPDMLRYEDSLFLVEHFNQNCHQDALQAFCKYKGLDVEEAHLVGVDSVGMDVKVFSGTEVKIHRFAFQAQADSRHMAGTQIVVLLYPLPRQKKEYEAVAEKS